MAQRRVARQPAMEVKEEGGEEVGQGDEEKNEERKMRKERG